MSTHPGAPIPRGKGAVTQHAWPDDCAVQAGLDGLVIVRDPEQPNYSTAFFEAFPRSPKTFLRGEGATVEEAEAAAWAKWQRIASCPGPEGHEYETRGYKNGAGFCKHCGMFATDVFLVSEVGDPCAVCAVRTNWHAEGGKTYCQEHMPRQPCEDCGSPLSKYERYKHFCGGRVPPTSAEVTRVIFDLLGEQSGPLVPE